MFRFHKKTVPGQVDLSRLPRHIGIIMDGNGRWAQKRGLPRSAGHRAGANTLKEIITFASEIGIEYVTVYAFSTENWSRPKAEVDALMDLLLEYLLDAERQLIGKNNVIKVIGDTAPLSDEIKKQIAHVEEISAKNDGLTLAIAINYGGRNEIVNAVKGIVRDDVAADSVDEELVEKYLYTKGFPALDLLIRPSGEQRLSNFLLWQCAYAEFWYSDVLWPDFSKKDLLRAIGDYQARSRRFGGV